MILPGKSLQARDLNTPHVAQIANEILNNPFGFIPPILCVVNDVPEAIVKQLTGASNEQAKSILLSHPNLKFVVYGATHTVFAYKMLLKQKSEEITKACKKWGFSAEIFFTKDTIVYINLNHESALTLAARHNTDSSIHRKMEEFEKLDLVRRVS